MNIKNYTSTVTVDKSVTFIEHRLVAAGANHISKVYDGSRLKGIMFQIPINGIPTLFKLPAKTEVVEKVLKKEVRRPVKDTYKRIEEQAERTAFKILSDWVDIQVSLIQLGQAEIAEVFLPYYYNPATDKTLFEMTKESNYKLLTAGGNK